MRRILCVLLICLCFVWTGTAEDLPFAYVNSLFLWNGEPVFLSGSSAWKLNEDGNWTKVNVEITNLMTAYGDTFYSLEQTLDDDEIELTLKKSTDSDPISFETVAECDLPEDLEEAGWLSIDHLVTNGKKLAFLVQAENAENWAVYDLYSMDLTDGSFSQPVSGFFYDLAMTEDGQLLALSWDMNTAYMNYTGENELELPELLYLDGETGSQLKRVTLPSENCGSLAYDATEKAVLVADESQLYRLDADCESFELCSYLVASSSRRYSRAVAENGRYTTYFFSGNMMHVQSVSTDPASIPSRILTINGNMNNQAVQAFDKLHPEAAVFFTSGLDSSADAVSQQMMSGSTAADIYEISLTDGSFDAICRKGYYVDLSRSEVIRETLDTMYPHYVAPLRGDGLIFGFPGSLYMLNNAVAYNSYVWEQVGLTDEDVPTTFSEFFDLIGHWERELSDDHPEFSLRTYSNHLDSSLLQTLLFAQVAECAKEGEPIHFDTPAFLDALKHLEAILPELRGYNTEEEDYSWTYSELPTTLLSDFGYSPLPNEYVNSSPYDPAQNREVLLPLALSAGDDALYPVTLTAYVINPYSENQDLAMAFLEFNAQNLTELTKILFVQGYDEPLEDANYRSNIESLQTYEDEVRTLMEEADSDEARASWEESMSFITQYREQLEKLRYAVSPDELDAYHATAENYVVIQNISSFWKEETSSLQNRFLQGMLSAEQFVKEYQRILRMIQMEAE